MDNYEGKGTAILKYYGVKNFQDSKEQAVLLGVIFIIMPVLLTKYLDFLAVDSTGCRNSLNFLNTAFIVRSDEPCSQVVATFESTASSFFKSYLNQKDANGHNKNEFRLSEKRGSKNKKKSHFVLGEFIQLQDTIFNALYQIVKIVEIIGESRVIVNIIFKNGDKDQCIVQLDKIADMLINKKSQAFMLPKSGYFETYLRNWKKPYIVSCDAEFKTMNEEELSNISVNAFKIDKYKLLETGNIKHLYLCVGKIKLTRQIDQWLPLILVINVVDINITDEGTYLENKDLLEEIDFPSENVDTKQ
ncbi:23013_t:CDS:2, partial [Cetraspora pellucida]